MKLVISVTKASSTYTWGIRGTYENAVGASQILSDMYHLKIIDSYKIKEVKDFENINFN